MVLPEIILPRRRIRRLRRSIIEEQDRYRMRTMGTRTAARILTVRDTTTAV